MVNPRRRVERIASGPPAVKVALGVSGAVPVNARALSVRLTDSLT